MFSCEICKTFKNTFFYRTPPVAASEYAYEIEIHVIMHLLVHGKSLTMSHAGNQSDGLTKISDFVDITW